MLSTVRRVPRNRSAFTLLEVLVVVAILVILASVATIATTRYLEDARKSKAHLGCQSIAQAIEAYTNSAQNPGISDEERLPTAPEALVQVPFGGPSFLRNGESDLYDPWGKKYQFQMQPRNDGTVYIIVHTTAPDGTIISQHGIGELNAQPKN